MKYIFWICLFGFSATNLFSQTVCGDISVSFFNSPDTYQFEVTNLDSLSPPYTYFWDFDNGVSTNQPSPIQSFSGTDTLDVCVTVLGFLGGSCSDCITIFVPASGPEIVWPGDINNNGIANNVDLLYLGNAFQSNGPPRQMMGIEWEPNLLQQPWGTTFPNGTDFAFADCDGNSIVNAMDLDAISANYNEVHSFVSPDSLSPATPGFDPPLFLAFAQDSVLEGTAYQIPIILGEQQLPVDDFYGITFSIDYDTTFIDASSIFIVWDQTAWVSQINFSDILTIEHNNIEESKFELGLTRTDHTPISGFGEIGTLHIIMEDNISGLQPGQQVPMQVKIDEVLMVDENLDVLGVVPSDWVTNVVSTSIIEVPELNETITVFPNPSNGQFYIETEKFMVEEVQMFNSLGQLMVNQYFEPTRLAHLNLPALAPGVYYLKIKTDKNQVATKVVIR
ncbi:MAG: T9SS type A sorting domain-containing protein [Bacteroidota bacterium]